MTRMVKLRKMGGSVGATLPRDIVDRLHLADGDTLFIVETEQGILLSPYDPVAADALAIAADAQRTYRNALRELAK
jgi:putative addiction module antidote